MDMLISFIITVVGGVLCHYKRKEESPNCMCVQLGDSLFVQMDCSYPFAYWHYSICKSIFQYPQIFCNPLNKTNISSQT